MKRKLLEKHNRLIAFILSILGVGGACTFSGCEYGVPVEYGTPSATFKVHGKISNEDDNVIPGIRVMLWMDEGKHYADTAYTNAEGFYNVQIEDFPEEHNFEIEIDDIDGESNGSYNSLDTIVSFVNPEFENPSGDWYKGETSKEFNIKLKEKN